GATVDDVAAGPRTIAEAGMRLFIDVTPIIRDPVGRRAITSMTAMGEARSSVVLSQLAADPRLELVSRSRLRSVRRIAAALQRVGIPGAMLRTLWSPEATRERFAREIEEIARVELRPHAGGAGRGVRGGGPPGPTAGGAGRVPGPLRLPLDRRDRHRRPALVRGPHAHPRRAGELPPARRRRAPARRAVRQGRAGGRC